MPNSEVSTDLHLHRSDPGRNLYRQVIFSLILLLFSPSGQFVLEHHTLPGYKSRLMPPDHLGGIEFDIQLLWSAQSFDSPYQLWRATSSYSRLVSASAPTARLTETVISFS